ncbi:MAG: DsbE family thiol:disulfide interchange protein [Pseudomonadota bacterium]
MRFFLPIAILAGLTVLFISGLRTDPGYIPSPLLDQPLPEFSLASLSEPSERVTHEALAGRPTLLNVWGSWCFNCGVEHGFLLELANTNTIEIFGLNWNDEKANAEAWLQRLGDPYIASAFDDQGRVAIDLGVYGAPETFLIDGNGTVVHKHIGPLDADIWARDFAPRLARLRVTP